MDENRASVTGQAGAVTPGQAPQGVADPSPPYAPSQLAPAVVQAQLAQAFSPDAPSGAMGVITRLMALGAYFAALGVAYAIHDNSMMVALAAVGATMAQTVVNYEFGSSSGSKAKDARQGQGPQGQGPSTVLTSNPTV